MFFITTKTDILDHEVTERLGIVYGVSVYSRTDLGNGKKLFNFALLNAKNFIY